MGEPLLIKAAFHSCAYFDPRAYVRGKVQILFNAVQVLISRWTAPTTGFRRRVSFDTNLPNCVVIPKLLFHARPTRETTMAPKHVWLKYIKVCQFEKFDCRFVPLLLCML